MPRPARDRKVGGRRNDVIPTGERSPPAPTPAPATTRAIFDPLDRVRARERP